LTLKLRASPTVAPMREKEYMLSVFPRPSVPTGNPLDPAGDRLKLLAHFMPGDEVGPGFLYVRLSGTVPERGDASHRPPHGQVYRASRALSGNAGHASDVPEVLSRLSLNQPHSLPAYHFPLDREWLPCASSFRRHATVIQHTGHSHRLLSSFSSPVTPILARLSQLKDRNLESANSTQDQDQEQPVLLHVGR
jgi:hypothetical protein